MTGWKRKNSKGRYPILTRTHNHLQLTSPAILHSASLIPREDMCTQKILLTK